MKDWKICIVDQNQTLYTAIQKIDESSLQIALIVDAQNKLLGTLTDGDVRRALLKGKNLEIKVGQIMNKEPKTVKKGQSKTGILSFMKNNQLRQIPILDEKGIVIGLEVLDELLGIQKKANRVVIMAGGMGTRLRPLTENCPKPMLKIGSKPILETIINSFIDYGFDKFYLAVNYKSEIIKEYFGDGKKWDIEINYLEENQRLGTAGPLSLLPSNIEESILVMNGDLLTQVNFQHLLDFHMENQALATMCVRDYNYQVPYGVIETKQDCIVKIEEKPLKSYFVNAGIYVLSPKAFQRIPKNEFYDMPQLFNQLIKTRQKVGAFPIREYWLDIGQKDDFERAQGEYEAVFA